MTMRATLPALTLAAALLAAEMAGISYALAPTWVWVDRGIEYPVLMGVLAFYIAVRGSGHYSLDQALLRLRTASAPVQSNGPNRSA